MNRIESDSLAHNTSANFSPSVNAPPVLSEQQLLQVKVLDVARAFEPKRVVGFDKVRVGRDFDGGYIQIDDFAGVGAAISCGISDDASWDLDIAKRSIPVQQFDPTIEMGPVEHPLITFHKQRVAEFDGEGAIRLDTIAQRLLAGTERAILKMDIEGHEWFVFSATSAETLDRFSQIVCEFHGFGQASDPVVNGLMLTVLKKLRTVFEVVHVHGNNGLPFVCIGNVVLPALLEVTFANRSHYQFANTDEIFPTPLDQPNLRDMPDMRLGSFKF